MRGTGVRVRWPRHTDKVLAALVMAVIAILGAYAPNLADVGVGNDSGGAVGAKKNSGPQPDIRELSLPQWKQMGRAGMLRPECPVTSRSTLRVVAINHYDFAGNVQRGRLVVNADVAESVVRIFSKLYEERFPIRRMQPVERYDGDTSASLRADNTSGYNCRRADQINAPFTESPHANGRAVDINPVENPWMDLRCDCWLPSAKQSTRVDGPGKIVKRGLVWKLFRAEGWVWQDIDVPDYMHFDTGYPSGPFTARVKR